MLAYFKRNAGRKVRLVSRYGVPVKPEDKSFATAVLSHSSKHVNATRDGKDCAIVYDVQASDFRETADGFETMGLTWTRVQEPDLPHVRAAFVRFKAAQDADRKAMGARFTDPVPESVKAELRSACDAALAFESRGKPHPHSSNAGEGATRYKVDDSGTFWMERLDVVPALAYVYES